MVKPSKAPMQFVWSVAERSGPRPPVNELVEECQPCLLRSEGVQKLGTIIKVQERTDSTSFDTPIKRVAHSELSVQLPCKRAPSL